MKYFLVFVLRWNMIMQGSCTHLFILFKVVLLLSGIMQQWGYSKETTCLERRVRS